MTHCKKRFQKLGRFNNQALDAYFRTAHQDTVHVAGKLNVVHLNVQVLAQGLQLQMEYRGLS